MEFRIGNEFISRIIQFHLNVSLYEMEIIQNWDIKMLDFAMFDLIIWCVLVLSR